MVRSARKGLPPGYKVRQLVSKARSYNVIFTDHTGRPALMSWPSSANDFPLPDLASWVYYMVNPDVPPDFEGCKFEYGLENHWRTGHRGGFRYQFFFLPNATAEECVEHYRAELEARGIIWRQIRMVEAAIKKKKPHQERQHKADGLLEGGVDDHGWAPIADSTLGDVAGEQPPG